MQYRWIAGALGLALLAVLVGAPQGSAQRAAGLTLSATLEKGGRDGTRGMEVVAEGVSPGDGTRLYVHYDQEAEECPTGDPEIGLGGGEWVMPSPADAPFRRLFEGEFLEEEGIAVEPGPARLCGYLVIEDELGELAAPLAVASVLTGAAPNPPLGEA